MTLIDIGANLAHDSFDQDRDDVIQRAAEVGVRRMILTGSSEASNHALSQRRARSAYDYLTDVEGLPEDGGGRIAPLAAFRPEPRSAS